MLSFALWSIFLQSHVTFTLPSPTQTATKYVRGRITAISTCSRYNIIPLYNEHSSHIIKGLKLRSTLVAVVLQGECH